MKEPWSLVLALTAQLLADGLVNRILSADPARPLAFDDPERDAVHEQHDVGPSGLGRPKRPDRELVGQVVDIALGPGPVDELQLIAFRVAIHGLRNALAKAEQLPHLLIGPHEPIVAKVGERPNPLLDGRAVERIVAPAVLEGVDGCKLSFQDRPKDDLAPTPASELQCFRRC